jgi:hypothetical protein
MGTTTNNGWTYPESTDLVKDGATAIQTLADDIDTTLGVYAPSTSGLTLINTTTFSGVGSQSFNDVFSATYDHYLIKSELTAAVDVACFLRFRVAGADNSTSNYHWFVSFFTSNTAIERQINTGQTSSTFANANTSNSVADVLIYNPFLAKPSYISTIENGAESVTQPRYLYRRGQHNVSSSFTGFTLTPTSGNISGTISVYGFNK